MNRSFIRYALGIIIAIEGFLLLLCSLVALIYQEKVGIIYLITGIISLILGLLSYLFKPKNSVFYAREGFMIVAISWIVISLIGAIPLYLSGEIPSYLDAIFEIVSGFTTTGSTICPNVEGLSYTTNFWRCLTHWVGGMGILVFMLAILPGAGGHAMHIMKAESPGPEVSKLVSKVSSSAKILYIIYAGITVVEILLLIGHGMSVFDAVCTSFGTAGTGGFGIRNDSIAGYSPAIQMIVAIFMLVFGVNFNVYFLAISHKIKDAMKSEEARWYLIIVGIATLFIGINIFTSVASFRDAFFQVSSIITTTGFATVDFDLWPMFSKTILIILMFIGACAGSTGGGLKVSRIVIMAKDAYSCVSTYMRPHHIKRIRFEGKAVSKDTLYSIRSYICIYLFIFLASLLIVSLDNFSFGTTFSAVAATLNNIGPGIDMVGPTSNFMMFGALSKVVLIFDMLAGRLELIPMLVLFHPAAYRDSDRT